MSPVEMCGVPNSSTSLAACVPLPAPGAPNNTIFMMVLSFRHTIDAPYCTKALRRKRIFQQKDRPQSTNAPGRAQSEQSSPRPTPTVRLSRSRTLLSTICRHMSLFCLTKACIYKFDTRKVVRENKGLSEATACAPAWYFCTSLVHRTVMGNKKRPGRLSDQGVCLYEQAT